jgi:hypothetical protein
VFQDDDGNGVQDLFGGEIGLVGWTAQLYWRATGELLQSATSDDMGDYFFNGLGNGDYYICIVNPGPAAYTQTAPTGTAVCGGFGRAFTLDGTFETWATGNDFAEMPI